MTLLELPQSEIIFVTSTVICFIIGSFFSIPSVWERLFPSSSKITYLKAGEYGETEIESKWSVFKEPLNAWTSLFYSLFGFVMVVSGILDYNNNNNNSIDAVYEVEEKETNRLSKFPSFSIMFGLCAVYLGVASFLFHASHSEFWRKADAGMTSGVVVPLAAFGIWDRLRPPAMTESSMIFVSFIIMLSFNIGYLPYGSSDVLLPSLVGFGWFIEFAKRYGGAIDDAQYIIWGECAYVTLCGVLLRAVDIKRKNFAVKKNLLTVYCLLTYLFGVFLGIDNYCVIVGAIVGVAVAVFPEKGHIIWHAFSSFALYIWWYMMRVRPGSPATPYEFFYNFRR